MDYVQKCDHYFRETSEELKGLFKRIKHVGQTLSNIVERNMFNPFEQHNQTCWIVLDGVG